MDTNRIPKQALQYKPKGRRHIGRPRKRWRDQLHLEDQLTENTPNPSWTWWWWWWWWSSSSYYYYYYYLNRNLNSDYSTLHSEQFLARGQIFHFRMADRTVTRGEYYIKGLIVECDWKICNITCTSFLMLMPLKRNSARSRLERSVFEYFISRGDRQTLKGDSDGANEMLRNESSSRFGQITSDGMLKKSTCHWHR